jgi:nitroreductase
MTTAANEKTPEPISRGEAQPVPMGPDAPILDVMRSMRAMRRLKPDPIPAELLQQIVEAAMWAPSAANSQAYSFVVVTDRDQMRRLAPIWRQVNDFYFKSTLARKRSENELAAIRYLYDHYEETPALIVACYDAGRLRLFRQWRHIVQACRNLGWRRGLMIARHARRGAILSAAASVYPAVENLLLAARALGLGATLTTGHLYLESEFKQVLGIPPSVSMYAIIPIGYPVGKFGPVRRRAAAEAIHIDRW